MLTYVIEALETNVSMFIFLTLKMLSVCRKSVFFKNLENPQEFNRNKLKLPVY